MQSDFDACIEDMARTWRFPAPVYVTQPNLPPLDVFMNQLAPAWENHWLTNDGRLHGQLESALTAFLGVSHLRLFCNGAIALLTALQALNLESGTVITTPFTFPATVNTLYWNRLQPVFCDIEPKGYNMDAEALESLITPDTRAILPVHVYGVPCDVDRIEAIAARRGLPVVYDAAHAFGVRRNGVSILSHGTLSMLSFHATKLFTTAEGGALIMGEEPLYERIRLLKNFGIADEETVIAPGINGKMSELHAALGLAQLPMMHEEISLRGRIAQRYRALLAGEPGIHLLDDLPGVEHNYAYFPVRLREEDFGLSRDALYLLLKRFNIHSRKYFYPLCSTYHWCRSKTGALPAAEQAAQEVLCLPIYGALPLDQVETIARVIRELGRTARA